MKGVGLRVKLCRQVCTKCRAFDIGGEESASFPLLSFVFSPQKKEAKSGLSPFSGKRREDKKRGIKEGRGKTRQNREFMI